MKKILIVEDNGNYASILSYLMKNNGYDVRIAESGKDALEYLASDSFDAAIVDQWMLEMDGISTISEMRKRGHNIGIILLTAMIPSEVDNLTEGLDIWKIVEKIKIEDENLLEIVKEAVEFTEMRDRVS